MAAWVPQEESVEAMARFHVERTTVGYDGVYVDDYMPAFYEAWAYYVQHISTAPTSDPDTLKRCSFSKSLGHFNCTIVSSQLGPMGATVR